MKKALAAAVAAASLAAPLLCRAQSWDARLTKASGEVTVAPADGSPEVSGEAGMPLEEGDRVVVADGATAEVALDGGSLITVRENSDFLLEKTTKDDSSFFLRVGSLLAKIEKLQSRRLSVRTPTAVAAVRGTEFGVEVEEGASHVGVFDEGKVEVTAVEGGKRETLISNQELSVRRGVETLRAIQLKRFVAHRSAMRAHARRIAAIRAGWKALPPEVRRARRQKALERMREHRRKFLEKRAASRDKRQQRAKENVERRQKVRQENLRKMNERRKKINRRERGGGR